jgi:PAS domain S-box-containing protein
LLRDFVPQIDLRRMWQKGPSMQSTHPTGDPARLRALARYVVLDTQREPQFDDIAELARSLIQCPIAGISFLGKDRVWFKSLSGLDVQQRSPQESFCTHSLGTSDLLVVPDATADQRFAGMTWVTGPPHVRFYAGAPIIMSDGFALGSLFVMDRQPRELAPTQRVALGALARQVVAALELRRTVLSYRTVIDGAGHVVFHVDQQHRLVSLTPTWARLTGYGVVRSIGQPLGNFVHPDDRHHLQEQLRSTGRDARHLRLECRLIRLEGDDVPVEMSVQPLLVEQSRPVGLVGVIADISERKAREIEAQHAQKLESLGRLSAGIAHEINTPIQFVGDNTRFLAESYETMISLLLTYRQILDERAGALSWQERAEIVREAEAEAEIDYLAQEVPSAVRQSLEGIERMATIVRAMKAFSHPGQDQQAPADLNEALKATLTVARSETKDVADVVLELGEIPPVMCHLGDLNQVFLNMIVNAADAIEEKGERGEIRIRSRVDGEHVEIQVSDTGAGIPESIRLKVFDPFFTTKDVGRGTGQGLALARAVVQDKHDGVISLRSQAGVGTTFTIRLPVGGRAKTGAAA